jgi:hypothetical protein
MSRSDHWTRGEIVLTALLVAIFAGIWSWAPQIKVSSRTLERYDRSTLGAPAWTNGIGLTIRVRRASPVDGPPAMAALLEKYTGHVVTVDIQGANYPTMVDLPYNRMYVADAAGTRVQPVNTSLSDALNDPALTRALETFDWSIVNNTFTRQGRVEHGIVLFPPLEKPTTLHLNVYHHPYKQIDLAFPLDGEGRREAANR